MDVLFLVFLMGMGCGVALCEALHSLFSLIGPRRKSRRDPQVLRSRNFMYREKP